MTVGTKADYGQLPWDGQKISAVTGQGVDVLVEQLLDLVTDVRDSEPLPEDGFIVHRPEPEGVRIERHDDGSFEVIGREAQRAVALSDLTDFDALAFAQHRLAEIGVNRALARAGAKDGDSVIIGSFEFEYESD